MAALTLLAWLLTTTGTYFWFNIGSEDRFRFEYGRIVWRHVDGGTARTTGGVDGGARRALWTFEYADHGHQQITRIPLWMPLLLFTGTAVTMTIARHRRRAWRCWCPEHESGG